MAALAAQLIVSTLGLILVAFLVHALTRNRELKNRVLDQRISYLVAAYRTFSRASHHPRIHEIGPQIEQAIADIQLFGTEEQIDLAHEFVDDMTSMKNAPLDGLLTSLRNSLRAELDLRPISSPITWLKIGPGIPGSSNAE